MRNCSPVRWSALPSAEVAKPKVSFFAFFCLMKAISSGMFFAGTDGWTTATYGTVATRVSGSSCLAGSKSGRL